MCMCNAYAVLEHLLIWQMFCIKFRILFSYSVVVVLLFFMLADVATFLYNGDNNLACSGSDETIACNRILDYSGYKSGLEELFH